MVIIKNYTMQLTAAPVFFVVRINVIAQKQTRLFDGKLAVAANYIYMQHEIQHGEIVSIGSQAQKEFPTAKIGDTLLFHHFVTGKGLEDKEDNPYLVYSDEQFNYYRVTTSYYNGDRNLSYAIYDGQTIIPHNDFVFLKPDEEKKELVKTDEVFEIKGWSESRDKKTGKMNEIKSQITEMMKSNVSAETNQEIKKKETAMNKFSKEINKKEIQMYSIEYAPKHIPFKMAGILNIACHTRFIFMDIEYIIAPSKYLYFGI